MSQRHVVGLIAIILGVLMVAFHRPLGEFQVRSQNQLWGFRMGDRSVMASRAVILIIGTGSVVFGVLMLAGVGRMRP